MTCSEQTKVLIFTLYIVSIVSALANPGNIHYQDAYMLAQGANIVTLLLLSYCKGTVGDAFIASALGVAFALRTTGSWQGGSRWDSLLVTIGMLIILQHAFFQVVPSTVPHRTLIYSMFSFVVMPVLSALPHLVSMPGVDQRTLQTSAKLSTDVYYMSTSPSVDINTWTLFDQETDTRAGLARKDDGIYVYFAGSSSKENWKTNINILGDTVPNAWGCNSAKPMRTHKGFTQAFESVSGQMMKALEAELTARPTQKLVFCGHSLGGALATMAAMYTACKLPELKQFISVVTFGAPQVGDGNFVQYFDATIPHSVRVVNPIDPVPRLLNIQLVHVKGYYPVGLLSFDGVFKAHFVEIYEAAVNQPRALSIIASFVPATLVASVIGLYMAWKLKRL